MPKAKPCSWCALCVTARRLHRVECTSSSSGGRQTVPRRGRVYTATTLQQYSMEALKRAAEEQMRRRAPDLAPDSSKRQKTESADGMGRFAYAAADTFASGSRGFLVTCGFRREKTSTKEALALLQPQLPEGTAIQLVKVGCRGVVVLLAASLEIATPVALVGQLLQQLDTNKASAAKSCQRIIPIQSTAVLTEAAVSAASKQLFAWYIQHHRSGTPSTSPTGAELGAATGSAKTAATEAAAVAPLRFAVAYKQRGLSAAGDDKPGDKQTNPSSSLAPSSSGQPAAEAVRDGDGVDADAQQAPSQAERADNSVGAETAGAAGPAAAALASTEGAPGLGKGRAIQLLAQQFAAACEGWREAKVDLSNPEVVIVAEVVPMARQHNVLALAVVPADMVSAAQKLQVRTLGSK